MFLLGFFVAVLNCSIVRGISDVTKRNLFPIPEIRFGAIRFQNTPTLKKGRVMCTGSEYIY